MVETQDGYRLTIFRCYAPKYASSTNRYPVMIQHAMLDSSDTYCLNPPNQALGIAAKQTKLHEKCKLFFFRSLHFS